MDKSIWQFEQIHLVTWTNPFSNSEKYRNFAIWTDTHGLNWSQKQLFPRAKLSLSLRTQEAKGFPKLCLPNITLFRTTIFAPEPIQMVIEVTPPFPPPGEEREMKKTISTLVFYAPYLHL